MNAKGSTTTARPATEEPVCEHRGCGGHAECCCDMCDRYFCTDHGTKGGDRQVQNVGAVAYPSRCWMHGGFDADEGNEDPVCECIQISEDIVDASFCRVHGNAPAPPSAIEVEFVAWECPQCGATGGTPVEFDFGVSSETGYHDAGEACTRCIRGAR